MTACTKRMFSNVILVVCLGVSAAVSIWALRANQQVSLKNQQILAQEQELERRRAHLLATVDLLVLTDQALVVLDENGRIVEWGPAAERMFGWTWEEVRGSSLAFLLCPADFQRHQVALTGSSEGGKSSSGFKRSYIGWCRPRVGELIPVRVTIAWLHCNWDGSLSTRRCFVALCAKVTTELVELPEKPATPPEFPDPSPDVTVSRLLLRDDILCPTVK